VFLNFCLRTTGGPRRLASFFEIRRIANILSDTERVKIHLYMSELKLPLLVYLQQKACELVLSTNFYPSIIIINIMVDRKICSDHIGIFRCHLLFGRLTSLCAMDLHSSALRASLQGSNVGCGHAIPFSCPQFCHL
jgi:hypothetical protein